MNTTVKTKKVVRPTFTKRKFDPTSKEDLLEYRYYIQKGTWKKGTCPFELEWPYLGIPQMLSSRIAEYYVTKVVK